MLGCGIMPVEAIWQQINQRYDGFSPQLRRAARYVRDHPQDVALNSLRGLASKAGVSPTSMTRLMQALQFENFDEFQEMHRRWLTRGSGAPFSRRAGELIDVVRTPAAALKQAAEIIAAAPGVAVAGLRSCFPVAFSLHYALSLFMPRTWLMMGSGGSFLDDLYHLGKGDAFVVVSVAPYSRDIVEAARHMAERGVDVIAITDGNLTPIARLAKVVLVAENASPAHIASPIGPIAVAQALALLALAKAGPAALEALRHRETVLAATHAYLAEDEAAA
jgi:DNA-binding MurR/RpiR family transcriptional regulator